HIVHFQLEFANDKFIDGAKHVTTDALQLLHEVLFAPLIENGSFDEQIINQQKRQLANKINAIYDNKIAYANERLIEEMFANEPFALHRDGYVSDLDMINGNSLAAYYKEMIHTDD